jgi:hypothetical protein
MFDNIAVPGGKRSPARVVVTGMIGFFSLGPRTLPVRRCAS